MIDFERKEAAANVMAMNIQMNVAEIYGVPTDNPREIAKKISIKYEIDELIVLTVMMALSEANND